MNETAKYKRLSVLFAILSLLCFAGPILYFTIAAFMGAALLSEKIALASTLTIALILTLVAVINKCAMRCRIWIILIGLYVCLDTIMTPLIIIGSCQIADELCFAPLHSYFKSKYSINKEIDKRL